jgi:hypothetical protein
MSRVLAAITAALTVASSGCAGRATGAGTPTSVANAGTPSASAASASAPRGDLPVSNGEGVNQVGFIHFPGGAFSADPAATMVEDPPRNLVRTSTRPYLYGTRVSLAYDRAIGRWLPASLNQISADGLHYAYIEFEGCAPEAGVSAAPSPSGPLIKIHVVDTQSASDRVVFSSSSCLPYYEIVSYDDQGIYLTAGCPSGCPPDSDKLWRLNFSAGVVVKISDSRCGWTIRDHLAWGLSDADYNQPSPLLRLDLTSGQQSIWLTATGVVLIGLDGEGRPLLISNDSAGSALIRVTAPQQTEKLFSGPYNGQFSAVVVDGSRTWFGSSYGIYLYRTASGVSKVSDIGAIPLGPLRETTG